MNSAESFFFGRRTHGGPCSHHACGRINEISDERARRQMKADLIHIADFTEQEVGPIVAEWVEFARAQQPAAHRLKDEELADHARVLLLAIAADVRTFQGAQVAHDKSQGNAEGHASDVTRIGRDHAEQRFAQGFSLGHLVSEFRALRASVIRRWTREVGQAGRDALGELTRFGEAMDQALTASLSFYSSKVDDSRNLLLGVLGHDLRTPIGVVSMTSDYLLQSGTLDATQSDAVARIRRSSQRMKAMVEDILDFTRTALGVPLPVSPAPGNIADIAAHIVAEVQAVYPNSNVELSFDGFLTGHWDAARIGQMLSNLVTNAVQHGEQGKRIAVNLAGSDAEVVVKIHNFGRPIPDETRKTLFNPLRQSWSAQAEANPGSSGLGLGLYIAREIALAHKGSIEVSSDEQGTAFCIRLPRSGGAA